MLVNSFQFRLIIAEMLFCFCFSWRREFHFFLIFSIALLIALPEMAGLIGERAFYTLPVLRLLEVDLSFLIIFIISLTIIAICFRVTFCELLFLGAGAFILQNLIYDVAWAVKLLFFPEITSFLLYDNFDIFSTSTVVLFYNMICAGILITGYAILYLIFIRRWNKDHQLYVNGTRLIFFLIVTIVLLNIISSLATNTDSANIFVVILLAVCSIALLLIQFNIFDLSRAQYEKDMDAYMERAALRQQKMSNEAVDLINIKAHDLKHSLEVIKQELGGDEVRQELLTVERAINDYDAIIKTGNKALDTILTEKNLNCIQNGIEFTFTVDGKALSFMNSIDIYLLFGNALDNAIECLLTEDMNHRIITLRIFEKGNYHVINLENYCSRALTFENGLPCTIKEDQDYHGFGMKSIQTIVYKYGGNMVVKQEQGKFLLNILFSKE